MIEIIFEYELYINNNPERIIYLRILAAKNPSIRTEIIRDSQIKKSERRNKYEIKRTRGRSKEIKNTRNST
jgi:hypothetical protein